MINEQSMTTVLGGLLGAIESDNKSAYLDFAKTNAAKKVIEAAHAGDFDKFYFSLQYPVAQVIEGLLAVEFPSDGFEARFLFQNSQFVECHIRGLIEKYEGRGCAADKTHAVMSAILLFLRTGKEIAFDYTQEYTFHLPKKVFKDHQLTMQFFKSLPHLYYGKPDLYLAALLSIQLAADQTVAATTSQDGE